MTVPDVVVCASVDWARPRRQTGLRPLQGLARGHLVAAQRQTALQGFQSAQSRPRNLHEASVADPPEEVRVRWGRNPRFRQIRDTVSEETPTARAAVCVFQRWRPGKVWSATLIMRRTESSGSSAHAGKPPRSKRRDHLCSQGTLTASWSAALRREQPSARAATQFGCSASPDARCSEPLRVTPGRASTRTSAQALKLVLRSPLWLASLADSPPMPDSFSGNHPT